MAEQVIKVQYRLRGDTFENWTTVNPVLAAREAAVVFVAADSGSGMNEPATLLKIGDGATAFNDLPFVSAIAGDVPDWAKAADKPVYKADEIEGLADYISGKVEDTDTQYQIVKGTTDEGAEDPYTYILQSKGLTDEDWTDVGTIEIPQYTAGDASIEIVDGAIKVAISAAEGNALTLEADGLKVVAPKYSVEKKDAAEDGYAATYQLTEDGVAVGALINIPKDYLVKSAQILVVDTVDTPYMGAAVGDKYIDFVVNTVEGDGNESHIYLAVQDLVDEYTAGQGIDISDANEIAIKIDATNANGLALTDEGLGLGLASDTAAGAMSAEDYVKLGGIAEGANKVEASDTNGNVKIDGVETTVYTLPDTVLHETDTFIFDGGDASGGVTVVDAADAASLIAEEY